jgi:hypothetical protein
LFIEAMVLSAFSVLAGLAVARYALAALWRTVEADSGARLPFWMSDGLTPSTVAYGVGLMLLGAVIAGVFPALRVTGGRLHARLRIDTAGGGGYRFGGVWTGVIAAQVAVTVLFPAVALFFHGWVVQGQERDVGFAAEEYLSARLAVARAITPTGTGGPSAERVQPAQTLEELRRRLMDEPGIAAVAFADRLPGMLHPRWRVEIEGDGVPSTVGHEARVAAVDADFFAALETPVLSGRGFVPTDLASDRHVAIVNASFVERVLAGRDALGLRVRRLAPEAGEAPGPWLDIVGVVPDLGVVGTSGVGIYRPLTAGYSTAHVAIHVRGTPASAARTLRALSGQVDPTLRVHDVMPLDQVGADQWLESRYVSRLLAALSGLTLLLSLMAIYSVMAFTVTQRTRDLGIRVALGAGRVRTIAATIRRPLAQIGLGVAIGGVLVAAAFVGMVERTPTVLQAGLMASYMVLMLVVCLLAGVAPARRALRLEPGAALRADG